MFIDLLITRVTFTMRQHSRYPFRSLFRVKVSNPENGLFLGYVGDVSYSGLKLVADTQLPPGEILPLRLRMRLNETEVLQVDVRARTQWCAENPKTGHWETGCLLMQPSAEFDALVDRMGALRDATRGEAGT